MHSQEEEGGKDKVEVKSTAGATPEQCWEHDGDTGWDHTSAEAQNTEQVGEEYEHDVEYPILLWTVLIFGLGVAYGRCTVRR